MRTATDNLRAVKIIQRDNFDPGDDYEREFRGICHYEDVMFEQENLVKVLHVGRSEENDFYYYVMLPADPHIRRGTEKSYTPITLASRVETEGRLPSDEVLVLARDLAQALIALRDKELVHRDIKPANILFMKGKACLSDPGLMARTNATVTLSGTPGYFPNDCPCTYAADMFAVGKVIYHALTGRDATEFGNLPKQRLDEADWLFDRLFKLTKSICNSSPKDYHQLTPQELQRDLVKCGKPPTWLERTQTSTKRILEDLKRRSPHDAGVDARKET